MWMIENSSEYNPIRSKEKDKTILSRARVLLSDDEYNKLESLVEVCSNKLLDRDTEIGIMLDALELLNVDPNYSDIANMTAVAIEHEVNLGRISPVQGCIIRDIVNEFTPEDFNISDYISDRYYFKDKSRGKDIELDAIYQEQLVENYKRAMYKVRAKRLMTEANANEFATMLDEKLWNELK